MYFRFVTRILILFCLFFQCIWLDVKGQTILVQPYLQNANPTSIVIMWETNINTESIVQYGLTQSLGNSTSGTTITSLGGTILHTVQLNDLVPGTKYYYKAITGIWQSAIYDFVTPPLRNSEANLNIVLMSDMQKDGSNPTIFSNLINTSLLPYISAHYGSPLSEHLQMAVLPGDVVDNGNSYLQWKNDFFNPGEALWRSVPCYPAIGNHEANSQNYFNYYNLPMNGTSGYMEHWYSHDYSNVRVLSMDSNNPYRIQAQLDWLDSMLTVSCADPLIDFVFAQMHHPFKSELWVPGEADFTGEIVHRLETFSTSCGKPSIHFFGHTHAYSRGESKDHQHLWVNVATSGGNIDYWGEFQNQDYDEFIVSQDEYGFVMVEVTAGENPQFVLKRLSFGDENNPGGSTETDMLTVRMNNSAPNIPIPLFPHAMDTVSSVCVTMKADIYSDPDGDGHGASQWQVSADSTDFSNPIVDSWKQYANWYNEVNLQAEDDLTDEMTGNLPPGSTLWWRVRYRDKSLEWSPWSTITKFQTRPLIVLTGNLIINPGGESDISGWTPTIGVLEALTAGQCAGISPFEGLKYFAVGALCVEHPFASAYQDINVAAHAVLIDQDEVIVHYGAYLADWENTDEPSFALQFLNSNGQLISGTDTTRHRLSAWTLKERTFAIPAGTRTIRYIVMGTRFAGTDNDSYMDALILELFSGDFSCSLYVPPLPPTGRIYVDKDAIASPDGESWATAYRTLGDALNESNASILSREIWLAEGVYKVTSGNQRDSSFHIRNAVSIYGGFNGTETSVLQRNILANPTILSGDIATAGVLTDNSFHVVKVSGIPDTVTIDGLTIRGGYADSIGNDTGGGIYALNTNNGPVLIHQCTLEGNYALLGGSVHNESRMSLIGCTIHAITLEGVTGSSILNAGGKAVMHVDNTAVFQQCVSCPEIIQNNNGASLKIWNVVGIERE